MAQGPAWVPLLMLLPAFKPLISRLANLLPGPRFSEYLAARGKVRGLSLRRWWWLQWLLLLLRWWWLQWLLLHWWWPRCCWCGSRCQVISAAGGGWCAPAVCSSGSGAAMCRPQGA